MAELKGERPRHPIAEDKDPSRQGAGPGSPGREHGIPEGTTEEEPMAKPTSERKDTEVAARKQTGRKSGSG